MDRIVISDVEFLFDKAFDETAFVYKGARIMDRFTKISMVVSQRLFNKVNGQVIDSEAMGVVFATKTGAIASIKQIQENIRQKGYMGINPSKFPNIMLSTSLSRIAAMLQAMGPSTSIYSKDGINQALQYAVTSIKLNKCNHMMVIICDEDRRCFGLFVEKESYAYQRGCLPRFYFM